MTVAMNRCVWLSLSLACCFVTACDRKLPSPTTNQTSEVVSGEVLISTAASTQDLIKQLAAEFSEGSPATIKVNPGSSSSLAAQILTGAPADMFLSASREWAEQVADAQLAESTVEFLTNRLVLVVPHSNPAGIKEPQDLLGDEVTKIALAGENVPAGKYADQALTRLKLLETLTTRGKIARAQDVRGALSFVERGEAEAGIVYLTDANVSTKVEVVHELDPALHDEIVYVLVLLRRGVDNPTAQSFFTFLRSPDADAIYTKAGFRRLK
jgi:molybdate transport system substrate-binding protein